MFGQNFGGHENDVNNNRSNGNRPASGRQQQAPSQHLAGAPRSQSRFVDKPWFTDNNTNSSHNDYLETGTNFSSNASRAPRAMAGIPSRPSHIQGPSLKSLNYDPMDSSFMNMPSNSPQRQHPQVFGIPTVPPGFELELENQVRQDQLQRSMKSSGTRGGTGQGHTLRPQNANQFPQTSSNGANFNFPNPRSHVNMQGIQAQDSRSGGHNRMSSMSSMLSMSSLESMKDADFSPELGSIASGVMNPRKPSAGSHSQSQGDDADSKSQASQQQSVQFEKAEKYEAKKLMSEIHKKSRAARFYWKPSGIMQVSPNKTAPNQKITVQWKIPLDSVSKSSVQKQYLQHFFAGEAGLESEFAAMNLYQQQFKLGNGLPQQNPNINMDDFDVVGLFRSRKRIDIRDGAILTREIVNHNKVVVDPETGTRFAVGSIQLRTPRGVGEYDFRYFKGSKISNNIETGQAVGNGRSMASSLSSFNEAEFFNSVLKVTETDDDSKNKKKESLTKSSEFLAPKSDYPEDVSQEEDKNGTPPAVSIALNLHLPVTRSNCVVVEVQGGALFEAFQFIEERLHAEKTMCNAAVQLGSLVNQINTFKSPLVQELTMARFPPPNMNQNAYQNEQLVQEHKLIGKLLEMVYLCVKQLSLSCSQAERDLAEIEDMEKMEQSVNTFETLEQNRKDLVQQGQELPAEDFKLWKKARNDKLSYERRYTGLFSLKNSLTSALRSVLDEILNCRALQARTSETSEALGRKLDYILSTGVMQILPEEIVALSVDLKSEQIRWKLDPVHIKNFVSVLAQYCPITNRFYQDENQRRHYYEKDLLIEFSTALPPSILLKYHGFVSYTSRNKGSFGIPTAVNVRYPLISAPKQANAFDRFFSPERFYKQWIAMINEEILKTTRPLIPQAEFFSSRLKQLTVLEKIINSAVQQNPRWKHHNKVLLVPFGSSINNYGSMQSDLDIVLLILPSDLETKFRIHFGSSDASPEELRDMLWKFVLINDVHADLALTKREIIDDIKTILEAYEVRDVDDARKTARIPILKFSIPEHGGIKKRDVDSSYESSTNHFVECDLCIDNRLALRNTLLLQTYSKIDGRIKHLAQIIKLWAKTRGINNPVQHTLPSYAYILMLIYYLQNVSPPILPVLQQIPNLPRNKLNLQEFLFKEKASDPEFSLDKVPDTLIDALLYPHPHDIPTEAANPDPSNPNLPVILITGADEKKYDTYFFADPCVNYLTTAMNRRKERISFEKISLDEKMVFLKQLAGRNKQTLFELLAGFFEFYAFQVDYRRIVISVRNTLTVSRENKASEESWRIVDKIGIEDPFETSYDVAHVLYQNTNDAVRRELVRAYAVLTNKLLTPETDNATEQSDSSASNVLKKLLSRKEESSQEG